ncbi:FitA-like ribbon-helix-helix domain-containing protein [Falsiroseomonas sp. HW251]|uniref:FitA-like ribbon-helix-helix domain-containing protein n=1 Tax=Falsiroseomonas sp. HW251 TaxID=3390998 RepID=UPI003D313AC9
MAQLLVRNVDEETVAWLKARAAANGRSVEAEHREILRAARQSSAPSDFWERAARLRAQTAGRRTTPSEELLREARDER